MPPLRGPNLDSLLPVKQNLSFHLTLKAFPDNPLTPPALYMSALMAFSMPQFSHTNSYLQAFAQAGPET